MTTGKTVGLACAVTVAVTSLLWLCAIALWSRVGPKKYHSSDIVPPMRLIIMDLVETGDADRHDDLKRKVGPAARYYGEKTEKQFKTLLDRENNGVRIWRVE